MAAPVQPGISSVQHGGISRPEPRPVARRSIIGRGATGSIWGYFFVAPSLLMFLLFSFYPMLDSVILSFQRYRLTGRKWVGLRNYQRLLDAPAFLTVLKNTILYALAIVPFGVGLSLVVATLIFRLPSIAQIFL